MKKILLGLALAIILAASAIGMWRTQELPVQDKNVASVVGQIRMTMEAYTHRQDSSAYAQELQRILLDGRGEQVTPPEHMGRLVNLDLPNFYYERAEYYWLAKNDEPLASAMIYQEIDNGSDLPLPEGHMEYLLFMDGRWYNLPMEAWEQIEEHYPAYTWPRIDEDYKAYAMVIEGKPLNYAVFEVGRERQRIEDKDTVAYFYKTLQPCFINEIPLNFYNYTEEYQFGFFAQKPSDKNKIDNADFAFAVYRQPITNEFALFDVQNERFYAMNEDTYSLLAHWQDYID